MSFFTNRRQSDSDADKQPPKPLPQHPVGFETVLGTGSSIDGNLTCKGNIRLDGDFSGTLDIQGNVLVGETAKINADIEARNISIAGAVRGNVNGNKVQLLRTGRIWGDIIANALTTEEGAFIDGKITMKSHKAQEPENIEMLSESEAEDEIQVDEPPQADDLPLNDILDDMLDDSIADVPDIEVAVPDDEISDEADMIDSQEEIYEVEAEAEAPDEVVEDDDISEDER